MDSQYKALNKELVKEVTSMRMTVADYRTEIVHLRAKLLEAETIVIRMRTKCSSLLKSFFKDELEILDPKSPLLEYLKHGMQTVCSGRRSTLLAEETRRSSSVIQTPRSFNSTSPVRSQADEHEMLEESRNVEEFGIIMEEIEPIFDAGESIDETTQRDISKYMANMSMASNTDSNDDEIEPEVHTLKDVTNTINGVGTSPTGREYVTLARGRYRCTPATHNHIESDIEVDEVRHYTSSEKVYPFSTYLPMTANDIEIGDSSSQDTFLNGSATENFLRENSSTPSTMEENSLRRPQRKCKPKSLKEMLLNAKLRRP
ncbi:uncharacterized protein LOC131805595 [Musca domestica]|uniref:Uncharacterized protein LOC131805595 n=1 Tax=Musca domestica TaxID=7370 RepID=A0ABM3VGK9_MUSDO|nr:uncharacterized protein LOC131805595 [Musca domestica]